MKILIIWIINLLPTFSMPIGKKPKQTLLDVQAHFKTLCLQRPKRAIWRCKARLLKYMEDCMSALSPRIFFGKNSPLWDIPFTPMLGQDTPTSGSAAIPTFSSLCHLEATVPSSDQMITEDLSAEGIATGMWQWSQNQQGGPAAVSSPIAGCDFPSLQGGQAAVGSPMSGWDSPSLQGGQAAVSSLMPGWDSPMAGQLPVDWVSSPTSPGCKVPPYAVWPNGSF